MNNLHYDYSVRWFTDWLDQKYEIEKKFINVHLPCGNNTLKHGKKLFTQMAIEAENRGAIIRFVVTDGYVDTSPSEDRIAIKPLKEHLGFGVNSMLISENHEVVLQKMSLQELESRKDLMRDYDIFVTDFVPYGDEKNDVIFPFDEYVIQKLPKNGLIISFLVQKEQSGAIDSYWAKMQSDNLTLIHPPTLIKNQTNKTQMRYEVWEKAPIKG